MRGITQRVEHFKKIYSTRYGHTNKSSPFHFPLFIRRHSPFLLFSLFFLTYSSASRTLLIYFMVCPVICDSFKSWTPTFKNIGFVLPQRSRIFRPIRLPKHIVPRYDALGMARPCLFVSDRLCYENAEFSKYQPITPQKGIFPPPEWIKNLPRNKEKPTSFPGVYWSVL